MFQPDKPYLGELPLPLHISKSSSKLKYENLSSNENDKSEEFTAKFALLDAGAPFQQSTKESQNKNSIQQFLRKKSIDSWDQEDPGFTDVRSFGISLGGFNSKKILSIKGSVNPKQGSQLQNANINFSFGNRQGVIKHAGQAEQQYKQQQNYLFQQQQQLSLSQQQQSQQSIQLQQSTHQEITNQTILSNEETSTSPKNEERLVESKASEEAHQVKQQVESEEKQIDQKELEITHIPRIKKSNKILAERQNYPIAKQHLYKGPAITLFPSLDKKSKKLPVLSINGGKLSEIKIKGSQFSSLKKPLQEDPINCSFPLLKLNPPDNVTNNFQVFSQIQQQEINKIDLNTSLQIPNEANQVLFPSSFNMNIYSSLPQQDVVVQKSTLTRGNTFNILNNQKKKAYNLDTASYILSNRESKAEKFTPIHSERVYEATREIESFSHKLQLGEQFKEDNKTNQFVSQRRNEDFKSSSLSPLRAKKKLFGSEKNQEQSKRRRESILEEYQKLQKNGFLLVKNLSPQRKSDFDLQKKSLEKREDNNDQNDFHQSQCEGIDSEEEEENNKSNKTIGLQLLKSISKIESPFSKTTEAGLAFGTTIVSPVKSLFVQKINSPLIYKGNEIIEKNQSMKGFFNKQSNELTPNHQGQTLYASNYIRFSNIVLSKNVSSNKQLLDDSIQGKNNLSIQNQQKYQQEGNKPTTLVLDQHPSTYFVRKVKTAFSPPSISPQSVSPLRKYNISNKKISKEIRENYNVPKGIDVQNQQLRIHPSFINK